MLSILAEAHFKALNISDPKRDPSSVVMPHTLCESIYDRCLPALKDWNNQEPTMPHLENDEDCVYDVWSDDDSVDLELLAAALSEFSPKATHSSHNRRYSFDPAAAGQEGRYNTAFNC
jgi:hypothetical protein